MLTIVSRGSVDLALEITIFAGMMALFLYCYKPKQMFLFRRPLSSIIFFYEAPCFFREGYAVHYEAPIVYFNFI